MVFMSASASAQKVTNTPRLDFLKILESVYYDSPILDGARADYAATKELYPQARAGWLPTISAQTAITSSDITTSNFSQGDGATTKDFSFNLNQPIFRSFRTTAEMNRAEAQIKAAHAGLKQSEQDLFLNVVDAFINCYYDRKILEVRQDNERILMAELKAAWERMDIGDITKTDVLQAKARKSRAEARRIQAQNVVDISGTRLAQLTQLDAKYCTRGILSDTVKTKALKFNFPPTFDDVRQAALAQNPEIYIARYTAFAADHNADAIKRDLYPEVSAFAAFNKEYDPQPGIVDQTRNQFVGMRATMNLYEGGAARSRAREAKRLAQKREFDMMRVENGIAQQTAADWYSYKSALLEIENRREEMDASQGALEGVKEEAYMGQRSVLDVLDTEEDTINARADFLEAQRNAEIARFALAADLGLLNFDSIFNHTETNFVVSRAEPSREAIIHAADIEKNIRR